MIRLIDLNKKYPNEKDNTLKNINYTFGDKGLYFILGKSGSGKSTLLYILGGLIESSDGKILYNDENFIEYSEKDKNNYRNSQVSFIFQEFNLLNDLTVYENILLALKLQNKKTDNKLIDKLLSDFNISELKNKKILNISSGQRQRVAIIRAIIKDTPIILCDEPTGNLDSKTAIVVMKYLKKLSEHKLVILVSHNEDLAQNYADKILKIEDGLIKEKFENKISFVKTEKANIKPSLKLIDCFKISNIF